MKARDSDDAFLVGTWWVHSNENRISNGDRIVSLEPRVMSVLECLASKPGRIISPEQLLRLIWQGRAHSDHTVYQAIADLRKALGDSAHRPQYIETIPKKGYRLISPVTLIEHDAEPFFSTRAALNRALGCHRYLGFAALIAALALVIILLTNKHPPDQIDNLKAVGIADSTGAPEVQAYDYYLLGQAYLHENTPSALLLAIENFKRAIEADASFAPAFAGLSESYSDLYWTEKDEVLLEQAKSAAHHALSLNSELGDAYRAIGYVEYYSLDYRGAIDSFGRAIRLNPNDIRAYAWLIECLYDIGENSLAESTLHTALQQNPMSGQLNNRMALHILRHGNGDWNRAQLYFQRAIQRDPDYPYPYVDFANNLYRNGELDSAIPIANKAFELTAGPTKIDNAAFLLALMLIDIGAYVDAAQLLEYMEAVEPDSFRVANVQIQFHIAQENLAEASRLVHRSLSAHLGDDRIEMLLAFYELLVGHNAHAQRLLESNAARTVSITEVSQYRESEVFMSMVATINLAYLQIRSGQGATADLLVKQAQDFLDLVEAGIHNPPSDGDIAYLLSQIAAFNGDKVAAIDHFAQAIENGWRRVWLVHNDPVMADFREDRRFAQILDDLNTSLASMRNDLKVPTVSLTSPSTPL